MVYMAYVGFVVLWGYVCILGVYGFILSLSWVYIWLYRVYIGFIVGLCWVYSGFMLGVNTWLYGCIVYMVCMFYMVYSVHMCL